MAVYRQEVRRLEEKFNSFEVHHILQQDNEAADALTSFGSSHESPHPGVFAQDLLKPSIRLREDIPEPMSGTFLDADGPIPMTGAPLGEDGPVPTSKADSGPSTGLIKPSPGPEGEVAAIVGLPSFTTDW
jgi:hypothetical protein